MSSHVVHNSHGEYAQHNAFASPQDAFLVSGSTFDNEPYQIALKPTEVAHGASGRIFKGTMLGVLPWIVAVKVIPGLLDPVMEALLARELRAARVVSVHHPYILPFLGTANVDGRTAIVSVFMDDGNLNQYIKRRPDCDKKKLILQVGEAVSFLHGKAGLVHGDIKCENVLISSLGDALLADFGLSTFAEKSQSATATMTDIRRMNTLRFAAPELLFNEDTGIPSKTCESDVYAFGMLVLEAMSEKRPWSNQNDLSVMQKVWSGEHPGRPTRDGLVVSVSHSWWNACLSCWNFAPTRRPPISHVLCTLRDTAAVPYRELRRDILVTSIAYRPNTNTIVTGSINGSIILYDAATGNARCLVPGLSGHRLDGYGTAVAVSPDGRRIAFAFGDRMHVWDFASDATVASMEHDAPVKCVAYSPDGRLLASGGKDHRVRLWDSATGAAIGQHVGHSDVVTCVSFSPDSSSLASGAEDRTIRLWNTRTGDMMANLALRCPPVGTDSITFSPDGLYLVTATMYSRVTVWDLRGMRQVRILESNRYEVWSVAFSPCGRYVASGSEGEDIVIWDFRTGSKFGVLSTGCLAGGHCLAFSPDGRSFVANMAEGEVCVWDLFE